MTQSNISAADHVMSEIPRHLSTTFKQHQQLFTLSLTLTSTLPAILFNNNQQTTLLTTQNQHLPCAYFGFLQQQDVSDVTPQNDSGKGNSKYSKSK